MKKIVFIGAALLCVICSYLNSSSQAIETTADQYTSPPITDKVSGQPVDTSKIPTPYPDTSRVVPVALVAGN